MPEHSELLAMLSAEYGITPEKIMMQMYCNSCGHGMLVRRDP